MQFPALTFFSCTRRWLGQGLTQTTFSFAGSLVLGSLLLLEGGVGLRAWAQNDLQQRYTQTQEQQQALQRRVEKVQREIEQTLGQQDDAREALRSTEQAISKRAQRLDQLAQALDQSEQELQRLQQEQQTQQTLKNQMQKRLAEQLRAQYASGFSPWVALLSAKDPQEIQRELRYLGYVTQAQAQEVEALNQLIGQIKDLQEQTRQEQARVEALQTETEAEQTALEKDFDAHKKLVTKLEAQLAEQRGQAKQYEADAERLSGLIQGLEAELMAQREAERQAAAEAQAQTQAEQEAEAQAQQQAVARAEQAAARAAQQRAEAEAEAARQVAAAEAAKRRLAEQLTADESLLRSRNLSMQELEAQLETAKKQLAAQEQAAAQAQQKAQQQAQIEAQQQAQLEAEKQRQAAAAKAAKESQNTAGDSGAVALTGLKQGAPRPAQGQVQGRFGMERPEGGQWRGVVIRASEGSPVQAVAAGEVVYADWLSGFGNLLILDHGEGFLTVYGYNQSLLKQVGERVRAGDTVALVGATGGQVEAGLYFEIRQQGQPVNPQQWINGL